MGRERMLLDRIAAGGARGGGRYEPSTREDLDALMDSVRRQLARLLNARHGFSEAVPDYGLPALTDLTVGSGDHVRRIRDAIRVAIEKYEPRLRRVRGVQMTDEDERQLPSDIGATHVTSRAVTEIDGFLRMVARFAQNGARVICMKGPKWQEELQQAQSVLQTLSLQVQRSDTYTLPFSGAARALIVLVPSGAAS